MCLAANLQSSEAQSVAVAPALRILCLSFYPASGPSVRHRIRAYEKVFSAAGVVLTLKAFLTEALYRRRRRFGIAAGAYKVAAFIFCLLRLAARMALVRNYDLVIIHREAFPLGGAFFERLVVRLNSNTIFDFDDAIWAPMPLAVNQRRRWWDPNRVSDTISACRAVVAGNEYLQAYARKYCRDVEVIPTPYPDLGGGAPVMNHAASLPIIVWIGNVGNEEYLSMLSLPLRRLAKRFDFIFRVIGSCDVMSLHLDGVRVETLEWCEDKESEWLLQCSIGVMPLEDREYERGKCSFKLVQYFSAGMPVVASSVGMNADVVRNGENGFLARTDEEWHDALASLLEDGDRRRRMGASAYASYRERFTPEINGRRWLQFLRRLEILPSAGRPGE